MKRQRGRGGRKSNGQANRHFESNGPDVKIRGSASHVYDKYLQLARDATSSGDRIMAENHLQHAEHYYRLMQTHQKAQRERAEAEAENAADGQPALTEANNHDTSTAMDVVDVAADGAEQPPINGAAATSGGEEQPAPKPRRTRRPRRQPAASAEQTAEAREALDAAPAEPVGASEAAGQPG